MKYDLVSTAGAAELLGCSREYARQLIARYGIEAVADVGSITRPIPIYERSDILILIPDSDERRAERQFRRR